MTEEYLLIVKLEILPKDRGFFRGPKCVAPARGSSETTIYCVTHTWALISCQGWVAKQFWDFVQVHDLLLGQFQAKDFAQAWEFSYNPLLGPQQQQLLVCVEIYLFVIFLFIYITTTILCKTMVDKANNLASLKVWLDRIDNDTSQSSADKVL